ncbi:Isochorismatase-like protein [Kalaharituber pfeilii]|nr:Isochorismatase-like protein [Kalaharituber pfeilii]
MKNHMLFICDIQEGFSNAIHEFPVVISTARKLIDASGALSLPIILTTQNRSRLGNTVSDLLPVLETPRLLINQDKTLFSMMTPEVRDLVATHKPDAVAIVGIESHVCVLQTCLDLLDMGIKVYIVADGVSSCNKEEIPIALARMRQAGAAITTSESWLYEVMEDAGCAQFRDVLKVVKATKDSTKDGLGRLCKSSL